MYTMFLNVTICVSDVESPREAYDKLCTILGRHEEIDFHTDKYLTESFDEPRDVEELYNCPPASEAA